MVNKLTRLHFTIWQCIETKFYSVCNGFKQYFEDSNHIYTTTQTYTISMEYLLTNLSYCIEWIIYLLRSTCIYYKSTDLINLFSKHLNQHINGILKTHFKIDVYRNWTCPQ